MLDKLKGRLPHRQDGALRRLDGRGLGVDVCRHPPRLVDGLVAMNGTVPPEYENFREAIRQSFGGGKAEIPLYKRAQREYWPERLTCRSP